MRWLIACLLFVCLGLGASPASAQDSYSAEELDQLVAPVALYPDPLLSNVLAAATWPDQVQAASGQSQPNSSWDASVQALCSYPEVLSMMAKNSEWSNAVGWAASNQLQELTDAVQRFRYKAKSSGNLQSDDKIQIIEEGTTIRIEPADPQVIYVPQEVQSDPSSDDFGTVLAYGAGIATSALLWRNVLSWNSGCWYHPPVGWRPAAGYYRPYGGNGAFPRATPYNRNNANINRPVNINNINTGNIRVQSGTRVKNTSAGTRTNAQGRSQFNNNVNVAPRDSGVSQSSWGQNSRQDISSQRPAMSDYSRAGSTSRSSDRGAYSRGSSSYSSGSHYSGGGRRGGGGGRRR